VENSVHAIERGPDGGVVGDIAINNFYAFREQIHAGIARESQDTHTHSACLKFPTERLPYDACTSRYQYLHQVSSM
jgi:hypothetical protein